jgi:hypothetical protein
VTGAGGRPTPGLRPLRLSLGNAPPLDVPARFIALGGVSIVAGCVLIAVWSDRLVAPGAWATPQALAVTHVLALAARATGAAAVARKGPSYRSAAAVMPARMRTSHLASRATAHRPVGPA